jgi:hypothetical protein
MNCTPVFWWGLSIVASSARTVTKGSPVLTSASKTKSSFWDRIDSICNNWCRLFAPKSLRNYRLGVLFQSGDSLLFLLFRQLTHLAELVVAQDGSDVSATFHPIGDLVDTAQQKSFKTRPQTIRQLTK